MLQARLTLRMSRLRSFCTSMRRVCATLNRWDSCGDTWHRGSAGARAAPQPPEPHAHLLLGELPHREDVLPDQGVQQRGGLEVGGTLRGRLAWDRAQRVEVAVLDRC